LSFVVVMLFFLAAVRLHLFGVTTQQQAGLDVHYILGVEGGLYLLTLVASLFIFPLFWHKSFFAGLQWNGATAWRHRWQLISVAGMCFVLALLDGALMPGPNNAPIEEIFQAPGAAWMLFAFGVTMAPFFEESLFRGFLLPALCTAYDWGTEKASGAFVRPLEANGHPQWSLAAKVFASVVASIPFAWLHAAQTSYSLGPFLLLVAVSLVLCAVRLVSRSLAASVFVHAFYNLLLFSMMMVGTGGFRNLDKM
jgi:membrane protease YdiL (CAAX protease family)